MEHGILKLAYFVRPHLGGTYSVYRHLRDGLAAHDIEVQWVALSERSEDDGPLPHDAARNGFVVDFSGTDRESGQAAILIETLASNGFDGVFVNVLAEPMQMNIARYLPESMLRIMIVHSTTPATYAAARSIRDSVHATVAVSPRARDDLIEHHGFEPNRTRTIPNAVDVRTMSALVRSPPSDGIRILFLGRIDDTSKGVFWLPRIMSGQSASAVLTVAGDGPDLAALKHRFSRTQQRVIFLGAVVHDQVPRLLADHDVLIMPSRYEGSPVTLVEAMAAGCVPVASRLAGITDTIVTHGRSGLLFPVGDWRQAARHVSHLAARPVFRSNLAANAWQHAVDRFDMRVMASAYGDLIKEVSAYRRPIATPLPIGAWAMPSGFRPGLRAYLPRSVKNWLRLANERLQVEDIPGPRFP